MKLEVEAAPVVRTPVVQRGVIPNEVREPRYNEKTGERIADHVRYTEAPSPASATTHGKFYTVHLQDASPEDRKTIEVYLGVAFTFDGKGVAWKPARLAYPDAFTTAPGTDHVDHHPV